MVSIITHLLATKLEPIRGTKNVSQQIVNILIQYASDITRDAREAMKTNFSMSAFSPTKQWRKDSLLCGKLDYVSVVCFRVN